MLEYVGDNDGTAVSSDNKALKLARLPRLYRLLRVLRLVRVLKTLKFMKKKGGGNDSKNNKLSGSIKQIAKIIFSILYLSNLVGCFWFFQSSWSEFPADSWV
jgi:hypothetical protein